MLSQCPPVFVIDNVKGFSKEDNDFLQILLQIPDHSFFVFADVEGIANMICGMNGKARINPLPVAFGGDVGGDDAWEIVDDQVSLDQDAVTSRVAPGIQWAPQPWSRKS